MTTRFSSVKGHPYHLELKSEDFYSVIFSNVRRGSIIFTTRDMRLSSSLTDGNTPLEVPQLDIGEAKKLFLSKLPAGYEIEKENTNVTSLLQKLDFLPLAITQAAAFIRENRIRTADYIDILEKGDLDLIDLLSEDLHDSRRNLDMSNSVIQTWKISFDQIQKCKPRAAELLSFMAVLDRQGIPQFLLIKKDERITEFLTAIKTLEAFSLIKVENRQKVFVMHRLVQLATRK